MKKNFVEFVRFSLLGGVGVGIGYITLITLTELSVWYLLSSVVAYIVNVFISFEVHRFWTFRRKEEKTTIKMIFLYFLVTILFFGTNTGLIYVLVEYCNFHYLLVQLSLTLVLGIPNWYLSAKVFKL